MEPTVASSANQLLLYFHYEGHFTVYLYAYAMFQDFLQDAVTDATPRPQQEPFSYTNRTIIHGPEHVYRFVHGPIPHSVSSLYPSTQWTWNGRWLVLGQYRTADRHLAISFSLLPKEVPSPTALHSAGASASNGENTENPGTIKWVTHLLPNVWSHGVVMGVGSSGKSMWWMEYCDDEYITFRICDIPLEDAELDVDRVTLPHRRTVMWAYAADLDGTWRDTAMDTYFDDRYGFILVATVSGKIWKMDLAMLP